MKVSACNTDPAPFNPRAAGKFNKHPFCLSVLMSFLQLQAQATGSAHVFTLGGIELKNIANAR